MLKLLNISYWSFQFEFSSSKCKSKIFYPTKLLVTGVAPFIDNGALKAFQLEIGIFFQFVIGKTQLEIGIFFQFLNGKLQLEIGIFFQFLIGKHQLEIGIFFQFLIGKCQLEIGKKIQFIIGMFGEHCYL